LNAVQHFRWVGIQLQRFQLLNLTAVDVGAEGTPVRTGDFPSSRGFCRLGRN
ncbi:hypothetical protein VCCP1035_2148B, partial [Vibrio cholerae CP1035(8)]